MAIPAALEPGPLVTLVRCLTVAKVDSMGLVVRRWMGRRRSNPPRPAGQGLPRRLEPLRKVGRLPAQRQHHLGRGSGRGVLDRHQPRHGPQHPSGPGAGKAGRHPHPLTEGGSAPPSPPVLQQPRPPASRAERTLPCPSSSATPAAAWRTQQHPTCGSRPSKACPIDAPKCRTGTWHGVFPQRPWPADPPKHAGTDATG